MSFKPNQAPAPAHQALTAIELKAILAALPGWRLSTAGAAPAIEKRWPLAGFSQPMALANAVAALAERLNHHPDLHIGYGHCTVRWTTHDAGGVTALDLDAARRTDALAAELGTVADTP